MAFRCIRCNATIDPSLKVCPQCGEPITDFLRRYLQEPIDGKYEILERLGVGGMGEVYKVRHTFLGATRVVKVIRSIISESTDGQERFLREARLATRVQDQNVATLHDFSALPDGSHYMVWEYIDGENLAQRIHTLGRLQPRQAVRIAIQTLHGLDAIHRAGIVHRDISPENIMLTRDPDERAKIIDLGVAKAEGDSSTQSGLFIGKLRYASPEHLGFLPEGDRIDGRADLYSLAVVLYEMLSGRPPFQATSPHEYLLIHSKETQFKPLDLPAELPGGSELQRVMQRALERERNKRFANAMEFANALEEVARSLPDPNDATLATKPTVPGETAPFQLTQPDVDVTAVQSKPVEPAAPPTVVEQQAFTPQKRQLPIAALGAIIGILLLAIIAMLFVLLRPTRPTPAPTPTATTASASTTQVEVVVPPATVTETTTTTQPTATTVESTDTTASTATVEQPAPPPPTQTVAPKRVAKKKEPARPVARPTPEPVTPAPPPEPPAPRTVQRFVEGGDSDANESAIIATRRDLESTSEIAVRGTGDAALTTKLVNLVKQNLTVSDGANVVVDFNGKVDRRAFGRKQRSATATISKNGRVVFRYEMPLEAYRVGDDPADAFARVLLQVLGR